MRSKRFRTVGFFLLLAVALTVVVFEWRRLEHATTAASPPPSAPSAAATETAQRAPSLEPYSCGTVERLHTWSGIFVGSQPSEQDLRHARDNGVHSVVNLRPKEEGPEFDEATLVGELGMDYVSLPFDSPDTLTDDVFARARDVLRDESKRPLFLHCHSGNRAGAIWAAFRALDGGLAWEDALAEAKQVGLKSPTLEQRAQEYVTSVQSRASH